MAADFAERLLTAEGARQEHTIAAPTGLPRLLPPTAELRLDAHWARLGGLPRTGRGLIAEIERAGLRGRGGAGFPTSVKMAAVAARGGGVVVANATEGEPASAKDKTLLTVVPHLVLDGVAAAAQAVGATEAVLCVERTATRTIVAVEHALADRRAAGVDAGLVDIRLATTPSRYIAGEETALVHWLNGGEAKPTFIPPRPFERGVGGRPTLVQNAETLAHVALIARFGSAWFRSVGTVDDPGSALVTVSGVPRPGVYEVALGSPIAGILDAAGQGATPRPVLVGGYFGTWVPANAVRRLSLSTASMQDAGGALGCGVLAALPEGVCGLAESARVTRWLADQNAGQCGPCVNGLDAIARAVDALVGGEHSGRAMQALLRWLDMVKGRGACRHPDGAARFVESALRVFADEIDRHRQSGACPASRRPGYLPLPAPGGWR